MKLALLASGISAAFAQNMACFSYAYNSSECKNVTEGCKVFGNMCGRRNSVTCPDTDVKATCEATTNCVLGSVQDYKTCNNCEDNCATKMDEASCNSTTCQWNPLACYAKEFIPDCIGNMNKASCTADAAGCFWLSFTETSCGRAGVTSAACFPCDSSMIPVGAVRGPITRNMGKTCSWPTGNTAKPFSLMVNDIASGAACPALGTDASMDLMMLGQSLQAAKPYAFVNNSNATCTAAGGGGSGSSMLSPSFGIMVVLAFISRM
jgi:hypothetical protein